MADSEKMFLLVNSHQSLKVFRKIGWVSIPSKFFDNFWCRFTWSKENFDQDFDGKLWSCKQAFRWNAINM